MPYTIEVFPSGPAMTNAMVLSCDKTKQAAIIDPSSGSGKSIKAYIARRGLEVKTILITHSHWDHIADVAEVQNFFHAPVAVHPLDAPNLIRPGSDGLPVFFEIEGVKPDLQLLDGAHIFVGEIDLEVIHTPGHSRGSVCLYAKEHHFIISGDLIFQNSIGRIDLPTSEAAQMWRSLKKIGALPSQTVLYPGHGDTTTLAEEKWLPEAKRFFGG
ncbi:MAG: MBL fold metallo-hydrolase [Verrucomicrobia bacterium]|nr:MBL fold metallo-hydrolase [Verrucomicrobiota bacterium]